MRYLRFSSSDSNYTVQDDVHTWELPLSIQHRRVGLSSFSLDVTDAHASLTKMQPTITVSCNLVDRTVENQSGILEIIPIDGDSYRTFSRSANTIGKLCQHTYMFYLV